MDKGRSAFFSFSCKRCAVDSRYVHGAKLMEVLARSDHDVDPLRRSVAVQWLEWV